MEYKKIQIGKAMIYSTQAEFPPDAVPDLTQLVQQYREEEYHQQITQSRSWEMMYQFAESRANLLEWLDFKKGSKILELGAGCGTITGLLLKKGAEVTCQEENSSYCRLNGMRHKENTFQIYADTYENCEKQLKDNYDYVLCIGILEKKQAQPFLESLHNHLADGGTLIISTENKFGLKYWAGNPEPGSGKFFAGLEDVSVRSGFQYYTKRGLERLLKDAGYGSMKFYYPYPDQRFPLNIYSDRYLPKKGELSYNIVNYEGDRLRLFDEQKVYDSIIEEGQYPMFANSFLCLAAAKTEEKLPRADYIRYATDRGREFVIRTELYSGGNSQGVYKKAVYPEGKEHIAHIAQAYKKLKEQYAGTRFLFNDCAMDQGDLGLRFALIQGESLQSEVEQLILSHQLEKVYGLLHDLSQEIKSLPAHIPFELTEEFAQVFGKEEEYGVLEGKLCSPVTDIDLVLSNILVDKNGAWHVIDYEWTFFFPVPQDFMIYRTLFFLHQDNPEQEEFSMEHLLGLEGIRQEEADAYAKMEKKFQEYSMGGLIPYREMVNLFERSFIDVPRLKTEYEQVKAQNEVLKTQGLYGFARKVKRALKGK